MLERINDEYFEWLYGLVSDGIFCDGGNRAENASFRKLAARLHETEFTFTIPRDQNRAEDGEDLRRRFALSHGYEHSYDDVMDRLYGPCSVLEMMIALAIRCEESIMDDPHVGDRTAQWFWGMITNLGLGSMVDYRFDKKFVDETIARFLDRDYEPNGKGGLFTIKHCDFDLRYVEIWYQLCWYLDTIT